VGVLSDLDFVASTDSTTQYFSASGQTNANIIAGLNIFGGIKTTGDVTVGGKLRTATTTGTPTNTSSPASWLKVVVGNTNYYMPLYQ
jgi:fructose-1,6-bisphosphatase/sedoheptulose 1,7-bisphosphatase-like protein